MTKKDNKFILGLVIVAAILFIGYMVWMYYDKAERSDSDEPVVETPAEEDSGAAAGGGAGSGGSGSGSGTDAAGGPLTFDEAYQLYAPVGFRFEFASCSGRPGSLSMKQGTKFMLDNRDKELHKFVVGSKTYNIGPYGFAIATASEVGTYNITCDGGGAAQVIVQP